MTKIQKIILVSIILLFLFVGFAWVFSDASLDDPWGGLLEQYAIIGLPAVILFVVFGKKK